MSGEYRSFTAITQNHGGRFISKTPSGAAKKVFSQLGLDKPTLIKIKETTQNSKNKEYVYEVKRVKTNNSVNINGQTINFKYSLISKSKN